LRPRLPRPGLFAEVRTALALRYMGGGSYVDMCIVFGVHSASVYHHCGQLPCRAPRWVLPTEGGWGGKVCSLKGRRVGRVAANSAVQRGASRVGCGVAFSGMFAAACVASGLSTIRLTVLAREELKTHETWNSPFSDVYRGINIRGDPAYVCTGIPSRDGLAQSNQRYIGIQYRYTVCNCERASGPFAVANRVTVYRRNVDLIGRARHATVYRYRHTRDSRVCLYRGIPSENGEFHVLSVSNSSFARTVKRIVDNPEARRDTRRCEWA